MKPDIAIDRLTVGGIPDAAAFLSGGGKPVAETSRDCLSFLGTLVGEMCFPQIKFAFDPATSFVLQLTVAI